MRIPKNRVVSTGPQAMAKLSRRVLSRMMKQKTYKLEDERRLILFLERLLDGMSVDGRPHELSGRN